MLNSVSEKFYAYRRDEICQGITIIADVSITLEELLKSARTLWNPTFLTTLRLYGGLTLTLCLICMELHQIYKIIGYRYFQNIGFFDERKQKLMINEIFLKETIWRTIVRWWLREFCFTNICQLEVKRAVTCTHWRVRVGMTLSISELRSIRPRTSLNYLNVSLRLSKRKKWPLLFRETHVTQKWIAFRRCCVLNGMLVITLQNVSVTKWYAWKPFVWWLRIKPKITSVISCAASFWRWRCAWEKISLKLRLP